MSRFVTNHRPITIFLVFLAFLSFPLESPADSSIIIKYIVKYNLEALEQRITILKAVFTELNSDASEDFLDQGLVIYDQALKKAKLLLDEIDAPPEAE